MNPDTSQPDPISLMLVLGIYLLPVVFLVVFGIIGRLVERRHYASIRVRERELGHIPVVPIRTPDPDRAVVEARLVTASVVVSLDYFKRFLAKLRNLIGGRVGSFESLLDRARREAVLRLLAQCEGADIVLNFRLETSSIANTRGKQGAGGVEVLAYGTMVRYAPVREPLSVAQAVSSAA